MTPERPPMPWPNVILILLALSVASGLLFGWLAIALSISSWLIAPIQGAILGAVAVLLVGRLRGTSPRR